MSVRFEVRVNKDRFAAGDVLAGDVVVLEGGKLESLTALLAFCESTPSYSRVAAALPPVVLCSERTVDVGDLFRFEIRLPADALPTLESPSGLTGLYWELDVWAERFGTDVHDARPIEVGA